MTSVGWGRGSVERLSEVGLDHGLHRLVTLGGYLIAALDEFVDELGWEDALATRDDLPELDVCGAEDFGCFSQATGQVGGGRRTSLAATDCIPKRNAAAEASSNLEQSTTGRNLLGLDQAGDLSLNSRSDGVDPVAPSGVLEGDLPRSCIAKRCEREVAIKFGRVGGGVGHVGHTPSVLRVSNRCVPQSL